MSKTNGTTTTTESTETVARKHRGPRDIYFVCFGVKPGTTETVVEEIKESADGKETAELAFSRKHKFSPATVLGPYYQVKGKVTPKVRNTITLDSDKFRYTKNIWTGEYSGWKVNGFGLVAPTKDYNNDDLIKLDLLVPVDPENPAPKPKSSGKFLVVRRDQVQNLTEG